MDTTASTQLMPAPTWSDPRIHLLDDTWLLTIFAVLLATFVPWLVSSLDIDFIATALGLLALGALHIGFVMVGRPARAGERRPMLAAMHVAGIVLVGFIWLNAGGLQNPAFLIVFALPVVGSIFLSRWQPYLMALTSILVVAAMALAQAPELRWYAPGLVEVGNWLAAVLGEQGAGASAPFPGFYAPSGYFAVMIQVFAILLFACAVAAEYLGTIFERLHSHVEVARAEAERGQEFWATLVEEIPVPAALVDADTLRILCVSERLSEVCAAEPTSGRALFETVQFSYPEVIQELISGLGGAAPLSMVHCGDRLLATEVRVRHLSQKGRRFALVTIHDKTDEFTIQAALDVAGQAVLVIDSQARVMAYNKPARALFASIDRNVDASRLLAVTGMGPRWWEPGLSGRRKMHVEMSPRIYQVTCSACPLPGEEERFYVVTLLPVARAAVDGHLTATVRTAELPKSNSSKSLASPP
jgi:PAS domain-containing protein